MSEVQTRVDGAYFYPIVLSTVALMHTVLRPSVVVCTGVLLWPNGAS